MILFSHVDQLYATLNQLQYDYGRLLGIIINLGIVEIILTKNYQRATFKQKGK